MRKLSGQSSFRPNQICSFLFKKFLFPLASLQSKMCSWISEERIISFVSCWKDCLPGETLASVLGPVFDTVYQAQTLSSSSLQANFIMPFYYFYILKIFLSAASVLKNFLELTLSPFVPSLLFLTAITSIRHSSCSPYAGKNGKYVFFGFFPF